MREAIATGRFSHHPQIEHVDGMAARTLKHQRVDEIRPHLKDTDLSSRATQLPRKRRRDRRLTLTRGNRRDEECPGIHASSWKGSVTVKSCSTSGGARLTRRTQPGRPNEVASRTL